MNFDFADILLKVVEQKASDLHITAGAPPTVRVRGSLVPLEGYGNLTPTDTREIVYAILSSSQRQMFETDWQLDFAYSVPGVGRFRVNTFFQRGTLGAAFRLIPSDTVPIDELGQDAPSFALGLKAALRQDPDVILVGEMRDMETIATALTAAETGHLVFATLH